MLALKNYKNEIIKFSMQWKESQPLKLDCFTFMCSPPNFPKVTRTWFHGGDSGFIIIPVGKVYSPSNSDGHNDRNNECDTWSDASYLSFPAHFSCSFTRPHFNIGGSTLRFTNIIAKMDFKTKNQWINLAYFKFLFL